MRNILSVFFKPDVNIIVEILKSYASFATVVPYSLLSQTIMSYFLYIGNGILHLFHNLRIALPRPVLCSKIMYILYSVFFPSFCVAYIFSVVY